MLTWNTQSLACDFQTPHVRYVRHVHHSHRVPATAATAPASPSYVSFKERLGSWSGQDCIGVYPPRTRGNGSYFKDCLCGGTCIHRLLQIIYVDAITIQANFYISLVLIKVNKIEQVKHPTKFSEVIVTHDLLQTWLGVAAAGVTEKKLLWCGPCPHLPYAIHLTAKHMTKLASPDTLGWDWAARLYHACTANIYRFFQPLQWGHGQHPTLKMCSEQLLDDCNAGKLVTRWCGGLTTYGKPCVLMLSLPHQLRGDDH